MYVDDVLVSSKDEQTLLKCKEWLKKKFIMTDLNEIKLFLGIRIEWTWNKMTLDQSSYLNNVLKKFSMSDCKPIKSPS